MPPPASEIDVDESLVRSLLQEQHPDLAELPLFGMRAGWDNMLFRLAVVDRPVVRRRFRRSRVARRTP